MFGNRGYGWKLAAAAAVVAALGILSHKRAVADRMDLRQCLWHPTDRDGARLTIPEARVTASDAAGFEVEDRRIRVRVVPAAPVSPGDEVTVAGIFQASGPLVRQTEVRAVDRNRPSVLLFFLPLALVLLNFLRHFRFRRESAQVEEVD